MIARLIAAVALVALTSACGVGSVSPIVTDATVVSEPRLEGTWRRESESAVITPSGNGYDILYTDDDGKTGRFHARVGRLGSYRMLDVQPEEPA